MEVVETKKEVTEYSVKLTVEEMRRLAEISKTSKIEGLLVVSEGRAIMQLKLYGTMTE